MQEAYSLRSHTEYVANTTHSIQEIFMKRIIDYSKTQDGALAGALFSLVVGCGFVLLHAVGAGDASTSLIAPLFLFA